MVREIENEELGPGQVYGMSTAMQRWNANVQPIPVVAQIADSVQQGHVGAADGLVANIRVEATLQPTQSATHSTT